MDYFTSDNKIQDSISDKINVYANKISLKKLFKRDENGNEQEVNLNNETPPSTTSNINLHNDLKPPKWTFLRFQGDGTYDSLNALLNDLCAMRTKSMINIDGRDFDNLPWSTINTEWVDLVCNNNTFSYRSREPYITANPYRYKFVAEPGWKFSLRTYDFNIVRTIRLEVTGKIYIQNTTNNINFMEFRFINNIITNGAEHTWPELQFIQVKKNTDGGQAQFYDFYFSYIAKYPTVEILQQKILFQHRMKPIVGYVNNSISYKIINLTIFCEPFAIGTGE